jgi:hypothetical protein
LDEKRERELKTMMTTADKRPRAVLPYESMTPEEFVAVWFYGRLVETFSVALVEVGARRKWPVGNEWKKLLEISGFLTPDLIFELAEKYYEPDLFWVLVERMCEQTYVMEELARRIEGKEIGKNLLLLPVALMIEPRLSVEKLLHVDKLKPFAGRENEYEAADLKQTGFEKTAEMFDAEREMKSIPLPPYPLKLRTDVQNAWNGWMAEAWRQGMEKAFREIKAGLSLDDETIRQKSRDHIRNLFHTTTRRKKLHETHEAQIRVEVHPEADQKLTAAPDISARSLEVLRTAKKRWGANAVKGLRFLLEGKTEEEAAKFAGINPRTLRNYKSKLTAEFSRKK